jgi:hypothetical protein
LFVIGCIIAAVSTGLGTKPPPSAKPAARSATTAKPRASEAASPAPRKPSAPPAESTTPDWTAREAEIYANALAAFRPPAIGDRIKLTLKSGTTQEGIIKSLSDSAISIERGGVALGFAQSDLSKASRLRCFSADFSKDKAATQVMKERTAFEAKQAAEKKAAEDARLAQERAKRLKDSFNPWSGAHIGLESFIKKSMHDQKSYKHAETRYTDTGDFLIVQTSFRGKNAFGAVVLNSVKAKCDLNGNVIEIIEQLP